MRSEEQMLEEIAALEHEQWAIWAKTLMATEQLTDARKERWSHLVDAPYLYLTEEEKEYDRYWARRVVQVLNDKGEK